MAELAISCSVMEFAMPYCLPGDDAVASGHSHSSMSNPILDLYDHFVVQAAPSLESASSEAAEPTDPSYLLCFGFSQNQISHKWKPKYPGLLIESSRSNDLRFH